MKFDDSGLVFKDIIAVFISSIIIYFLYVGDWISVTIVSLATLVCLLVYLNHEIIVKYKRRKNRKEIRHLFMVSTVSATVLLVSFPFYFMKYTTPNFNLIFGTVMVISFIAFIWSIIELIKEEFK